MYSNARMYNTIRSAGTTGHLIVAIRRGIEGKNHASGSGRTITVRRERERGVVESRKEER